MLAPAILFASVLNGLTTGAVYALIALGLTLIYGVLHIINFAHGASLMLALYAVYGLKTALGIDPYLALPLVAAGMFALGYALQRGVINHASHGKDENILLVTLGLAIIMENLALLLFKSDTRTIETAYTLTRVVGGVAGCLVVYGLLRPVTAVAWLGRRTLGIYALHPLIAQAAIRFGVHSVWLVIPVALGGATLITLALEQVPLTRMLLLGQSAKSGRTPKGTPAQA